jgi:5-formyltetrahydrofolate cyclo-ligase
MRLVSTNGQGGSVLLFMTDFFPDKQTLRSQMLAARQRIDVAYARQASVQLALHMLALAGDTPLVVAGYRAIRGEIDVLPVLEGLLANGHRVCLPVVEGAGTALRFRQWHAETALEKGRYAIDVPAANSPELEPGMVMVPLVAFDLAGHRLGYGAGYYDRTIAGLRQRQKSVQIIGVAYGAQLVERIPAQAHDARLDKVVTEFGVVDLA